MKILMVLTSHGQLGNTGKATGLWLEELAAPYLAFKDAHANVIPGIKEFVSEFTSDKAWGPDGYLAAKGLIAMPDAERARVRKEALELSNNVKM